MSHNTWQPGAFAGNLTDEPQSTGSFCTEEQLKSLRVDIPTAMAAVAAKLDIKDLRLDYSYNHLHDPFGVEIEIDRDGTNDIPSTIVAHPAFSETSENDRDDSLSEAVYHSVVTMLYICGIEQQCDLDNRGWERHDVLLRRGGDYAVELSDIGSGIDTWHAYLSIMPRLAGASADADEAIANSNQQRRTTRAQSRQGSFYETPLRCNKHSRRAKELIESLASNASIAVKVERSYVTNVADAIRCVFTVNTATVPNDVSGIPWDENKADLSKEGGLFEYAAIKMLKSAVARRGTSTDGARGCIATGYWSAPWSAEQGTFVRWKVDECGDNWTGRILLGSEREEWLMS